MIWIVAIAVALYVLFLTNSSGSTGSAVSSDSNSSSLESFMQAIFLHEGAGPRDRNNNPGNLKPPNNDPNFWNGQVGTDARGFAVFSDIGDGWDALRTNIRAALARDPSQTIAEFFQHYDRATGDAYAADVANYLGVDPNAPLSAVVGG